MIDNSEKIVNFEKYCKTCKYFKVNDKKGEEPCNECLTASTNIDSRKPIKYKKK